MIYGVSLGPGDPDLITLKGLKTLQEVDKIYYPGSLFGNGKQSSYSLSILEHYGLAEEKLQGFFLEMDLKRVQAKEIYETTFQSILEDDKNGLNVAIVSEGDISTFSSFSYLLEKIEKHNLTIELIPGITSFLLAASENKTPICLQGEKVVVLPRIQEAADLKEALANFDTVILMKIRSVMKLIEEEVSGTDCSMTYYEHLGRKDQFVTTSWSEIRARKTPYFSLMIIKNKHINRK